MSRWFLCLPLILAGAPLDSPSLPQTSPSQPLPVVQANDNRTPAGTLENGVLRVRLVASKALWYPEAKDGSSVEVIVFAEEGKAPQIPGPLIRVPEGTVIEATIRNALPDSTLWVHWLGTRPSLSRDSLPILPGVERLVRFEAGTPGTYMYRASAGDVLGLFLREREQLTGAFVVDRVGETRPDRVFVINIWMEPEDTVAKRPLREALAINGMSWPYTEGLTASTGDTLRWRIVNGSRRGHPMHLHGFYFRVDARGTVLRDTVYSAEQRRLAVTEEMRPFSTMSMSWVPERPGNWLFHCHLTFHVIAGARLDPVKQHTHAADPHQHMAGLILGIAVNPSSAYREERRTNVKQIKLFVNEGKPRRQAPRTISFVQQRDQRAPAQDSVELPSSVLVLTRGQATDIAVTNRLREGTAVHWHGIELESFSDGVAGFSGMRKRVAPVIAPGQTFKARLTLPRAGTFIYHTHLNDVEQITSGLYGAIIVMEPGQRFDPEIDHLYVGGWDGSGEKGFPFVVNGDSAGPAQSYRADRTHRFRFINIGPAEAMIYELKRDTVLAIWRSQAKDGADLPSHQTTIGPASKRVDVGETFDATFVPEPGAYTLQVRLPGANGPIVYRQRLTFK